MAFADVYPQSKGTEPLFTDATDAYLTNIPRVDSFRSAQEFATKNPDVIEKFLIDRVRDEVRRIETSRRSLGYYASVLDKLATDDPEAVAKLSVENQQLVAELVARLEAQA